MTDLASALLSEHARMAMARRSIAEEQLRAVLRSPEKIAAGDRPARQVVQGTVTLGDGAA